MTSIFDCIVVGAGVAGMTSAIYLKRAGLKVLLLEKSAPGGQINMSPCVENYPGFLKIEGANLALNIFEQTQQLNIEYKYGNVQKINKNDNIFEVTTDMETYNTKTIIIATGRKVQKLNLEDEENLIGKGISYCAICDANFFKNENVTIIGFDYKTIQEAIYLSGICKKVTLICEKNKLSAENTLINKIESINNIEILYNSNIKELIKKEEKLQSIKIIKDNLEKNINCNALFVSNQMIPQLEFSIDIKQDENYILVDKEMKTSIDGIFACGDIIKKDVYQLTTAIGEATIAAINVTTYLKEAN